MHKLHQQRCSLDARGWVATSTCSARVSLKLVVLRRVVCRRGHGHGHGRRLLAPGGGCGDTRGAGTGDLPGPHLWLLGRVGSGQDSELPLVARGSGGLLPLAFAGPLRTLLLHFLRNNGARSDKQPCPRLGNYRARRVHDTEIVLEVQAPAQFAIFVEASASQLRARKQARGWSAPPRHQTGGVPRRRIITQEQLAGVW